MYDISTWHVLQRGQTFFDKIYGKVSRRVMGQLDCSGTEDLGLVARLTYGYVLSNTSVLSPVETSYVMMAGLIPQDVSNLRTSRETITGRSGRLNGPRSTCN